MELQSRNYDDILFSESFRLTLEGSKLKMQEAAPLLCVGCMCIGE